MSPAAAAVAAASAAVAAARLSGRCLGAAGTAAARLAAVCAPNVQEAAASPHQHRSTCCTPAAAAAGQRAPSGGGTRGRCSSGWHPHAGTVACAAVAGETAAAAPSAAPAAAPSAVPAAAPAREASGNEQEATPVAFEELERVMGAPFSREPSVPPQPGIVLVISGPSGVGKDAVIQRLQEVRPELHFVVTATSRSQRPGEQHGRDYWFVSRDEFERMVAEGELLEHAIVYGEYKGIPKQQVRDALQRRTDVVLRLDVQGAATVRPMLGAAGVSVFLVAESELALVKRLVGRKTEPFDRMAVRVATAREELRRAHEFDYLVVNEEGKLDHTVQTLCSILDAEKARTIRRDAVQI